MEYIEAKELLENSVRCVAMAMEQIRHRMIDYVMERNEPMQDHLAECSWAIHPYEGSTMKDCLDYLRHLHDGLTKAAEHDREVNTKGLYTNDVALIADMLRGFICTKYPDYLLECARDVSAEARLLLLAYGRKKRSEDNRKKMLTEFMTKVKTLAEKHGVDLQNSRGQFSLPLAYLQAWMYRKYDETFNFD